MEIPSHYYCVILAGGKGKRLWPVSREQKPKQFIDFFGTGRTLLQSTYDRFCQILRPENIYVCTCRDYEALVREQLPTLKDEQLLAEPIHRNTAPSVAWANRRIRLRCPEASIIVTPADQLVLNEDAFRANVLHGLDFVSRNDLLLTMGIQPTRPEPGYGYIQVGEPTLSKGIHKVQSFTEKPEREFARMFMESGEFLWNTGLVLASARYIRQTMIELFPAIPAWLDTIHPEDTLQQEMKLITEHFPSYPNVSMDRGILERSDNVYVMKCDFGWADIGTWHAIYECMQRQADDNVVLDSEVLLEDCRDNIIKLPRGHIGVINGLEGYIVAEEGDVLLICKKGDSSAMIRKYANEVGIRYGERYV